MLLIAGLAMGAFIVAGWSKRVTQGLQMDHRNKHVYESNDLRDPDMHEPAKSEQEKPKTVMSASTEPGPSQRASHSHDMDKPSAGKDSHKGENAKTSGTHASHGHETDKSGAWKDSHKSENAKMGSTHESHGHDMQNSSAGKDSGKSEVTKMTGGKNDSAKKPSTSNKDTGNKPADKSKSDKPAPKK